jgi:hypothetical protein
MFSGLLESDEVKVITDDRRVLRVLKELREYVKLLDYPKKKNYM